MAHTPALALSLPPGVWQGQAWASAQPSVLSTGHAALDAVLPGGGWPCGTLSELLLPPRAACEWAVLLPALARSLQQGPGRAVLVAPPHEPFAPALAEAGVAVQRLCSIHPSAADPRGVSAAWACEQALRCRDVCAVLAWLPHARAADLRRLQLAAAQRQALLWVLRPAAQAAQASPAPLRLALQHQGEQVAVQVLKRRGPPLATPVLLPARSPALAAALQAQALRRRDMQQHAQTVLNAMEAQGHSSSHSSSLSQVLSRRAVPGTEPEGARHALARLASAH